MEASALYERCAAWGELDDCLFLVLGLEKAAQDYGRMLEQASQLVTENSAPGEAGGEDFTLFLLGLLVTARRIGKIAVAFGDEQRGRQEGFAAAPAEDDPGGALVLRELLR